MDSRVSEWWAWLSSDTSARYVGLGTHWPSTACAFAAVMRVRVDEQSLTVDNIGLSGACWPSDSCCGAAAAQRRRHPTSHAHQTSVARATYFLSQASYQQRSVSAYHSIAMSDLSMS
eukprot:COSAG01_NODE_3128_length_6541_cov_14.744334_1_plen_116_part_10